MLARIKQIMELENLSSSQFADEIGVKRSALSHVMSGRNNPSLDFVMKIKACFNDISLDWLLLGKGNMLVSKNENVPNNLIHDKAIEKFNSDDEGNIETLFNKTSDRVVNNPTSRQNDLANHPQGEFTTRKGGVSKVILLYEDGSFKEYVK